jgi:hypothetical protein
MTIPKGAEGDRLAARVTIPLLAATGYGGFNLFYSGSGGGYFYTLIPLLGGIAEDAHALQILLQSIKTLAEKGLGRSN